MIQFFEFEGLAFFRQRVFLIISHVDFTSLANQVNLTMALVPLDERLKTKEKVWEAERGELVLKVEEGQRSVETAEGCCRELEIRMSEMEEERYVIVGNNVMYHGAITSN